MRNIETGYQKEIDTLIANCESIIAEVKNVRNTRFSDTVTGNLILQSKKMLALLKEYSVHAAAFEEARAAYWQAIKMRLASDESSPSAVRDFNVLVSTHVAATGSLEIGHNGYLDAPVTTKTFHGIDNEGRVFVNLVVDTIGMYYGVEYRRRQAFIVFQRYADDNNTFVTGGLVYPMHDFDFFETGEKKFDCLKKLLSGESLTFFKWQYASKAPYEVINDPDNWVMMTLVL